MWLTVFSLLKKLIYQYDVSKILERIKYIMFLFYSSNCFGGGFKINICDQLPIYLLQVITMKCAVSLIL